MGDRATRTVPSDTCDTTESLRGRHSPYDHKRPKMGGRQSGTNHSPYDRKHPQMAGQRAKTNHNPYDQQAASSAAIAYDIPPSQSPPLARTTDVRDNTTRVPTGDSRLIFAQKKAKNDQVVQEVVRLFKAEVKDIQLK